MSPSQDLDQDIAQRAMGKSGGKIAKRILCVIGLPGSGKSTATRWLEQVLGASTLHLPAVVGHLVPPQERATARHYARLLNGVERPFLEVADQSPAATVVLDGFLRSAERVEILHRFAAEKGWNLEVLHLAMPGWRGALRSLLRQFGRDWGREQDLSRIYWKLRRDLRGLPRVLTAADRMGIPVRVIDAFAEPHAVVEQMRKELGLDLQSLSWDREMLRTLASIAPEAWVAGGGHVYRPFFDHRFGPPTESWDIDVRVWGEQRAELVQRELERCAPQYRWHVKDALTWSRKELARPVSSLEESLGGMALICICAGVRWSAGQVEIRWGHAEAERDLWQGLLRPNPAGQIAFAPAKARKIISYYPAVSAPFLGHEPVPIALTYAEAMAQVRDEETGAGGRRRCNGLTRHERALAERILELRRSLPCIPLRVPWPSPAAFPVGDPWTSKDAHFRVWLVNQVRSRNPVGGRDPYLENALRCQTGVAQKRTHQGWSLHLHALHALLELETDRLPEYRRPLRLAMLWHDVGKLWNTSTPGAHSRIGAKKWLELQQPPFPGLTAAEESLVSHFLACHDLFGRLERALWDEGYPGGMDPAAVRRALESPLVPLPVVVTIAKATWRADVGSVPLLRWLLPLADPLEELILGQSVAKPPV